MRELQTRLTQQAVSEANMAYSRTLTLTIWLSVIVLLVGAVAAVIVYRCTSREAQTISDNLTALEDSYVQLEERANKDALTGLPNRAALFDYLSHLFAVSEPQHEQFALMFFDLDRFKPVNDQLGHDAGDELLRQVADRISALLRREDVLARFGGDEFVAVTRHIEGSEGCQKVASKIVKAIQAPFEINGETVEIGTSIGISFYPEHGTQYDLLIKRADDAMYRAKRAGRNDFVVYSPA
ncbi:hypothetical protein BOW53_07435 [Solemya pervernicosa gill symbiont]|uniref:GGDEF domain-containing protein n=2 Tax=Gammaproteobacteria incertae sedis TaxID=118884 RepID=A0A1T2L606_9GAMM|nr:GGDEF domain-containing protein [Candidatus Reidiella endopervernicosa]OOZ40537.1 hypothetical protein BOW53_07435 [Solemya pervernicosa gill symbiont]QKQ27527.1 GGDEF domain-containing protein [Candidatus Reidiella endopervernicosa]